MTIDALGGNAAKKLGSYISRVENLIDERKATNKDIVDVLNEAVADGFDKKIIRKVVQRRAVARADLAEQDALIETYEGAVNGESDD